MVVSHYATFRASRPAEIAEVLTEHAEHKMRSDDAGRRWKSVLPPRKASRVFFPTAGSFLKRATPTADFRGRRRVT